MYCSACVVSFISASQPNSATYSDSFLIFCVFISCSFVLVSGRRLKMKQSTAILLSSVRRRLVQIPTAALTLPKRSVITLPQPITSDVAFPTPPLNTLHPELLHASQVHPPSGLSSSPSSSSSFQTSSSSGPFIDISSNASTNSSSSPPSSHSNHPYAGQHVQPTSAPALVEPLNLPRPPHSPPRSKEFHPHPFDTHSIVKHLEKSTIESGVARELMLATRALVIARTEKARDQLMSKEDMENQAYLFRAALSELRTVLSLRTRNEEATRRSLTMITEREVESLDVRIKESMEQLKHDIEIELENRKADTRVEQKAYEIAIEELNNKFTISLGDLRTDIEQYKWDTTRKGIVGIAIFVLFIVGSTTLLTELPPTTPPPAPAPPPLSTSSSSFQSVGYAPSSSAYPSISGSTNSYGDHPNNGKRLGPWPGAVFGEADEDGTGRECMGGVQGSA